MIAFMPEIYEDELCYSWFARYYCHSGYPTYGFVLDDLFGRRTVHFSTEVINGTFRDDARKIINDIIPMDKLVLEHTMFPYARFMPPPKVRELLKCMIEQKGNSGRLLPLPNSKSPRHLRYCPCCAKEQRERYGETFWTRTANINKVDICAKHRCRLKESNVTITGKQSARLYIAEQEIEDMKPQFVNDGLELQFASYLTNVFHSPLNSNNDNNGIFISDFLQSKLEGTKYLCVSGGQRYLSLFLHDFKEFYKELPNQSITDFYRMEHTLTGYNSRFYDICQIAFFLGVSTEELTSPKLPEKSQKELFNEKVSSLKEEGYTTHTISKMLGTHPITVKRAVNQ